MVAASEARIQEQTVWQIDPAHSLVRIWGQAHDVHDGERPLQRG